MARMASLAQALPLYLVLGLAACASPPPVSDQGPWMSGRLQVRVEAVADQPVRSVAAAFELRGDGEQGEIRLSTPLGTQMARATWSSVGVTLGTPSGERQFRTLDELSREAFGEALPLAAWPDWLAGRPWSGAAHVPSANGFEQLGWQVQVDRRAQGLIEARRTAPPAVLLRVRLDGAS
jgi:outer membrane lipoprotein LolB